MDGKYRGKYFHSYPIIEWVGGIFKNTNPFDWHFIFRDLINEEVQCNLDVLNSHVQNGGPLKFTRCLTLKGVTC